MSDYNLMDVQSRALEQNYVYYKYLIDTHPNFYAGIQNRLINVQQELSRAKTDGSKVRAMAEAEINKEISALRTVFKITSISDNVMYDKQFYNHLINVINECISIKDVYERNVLLIQNSVQTGKNKGGQKSLVTYFPTYFKEEIEEQFRHGDLSNKSIKEFAKNNKITIDEAIKTVLDDRMLIIVNKALMRMFSDKTKIESAIKGLSQEEQVKYQAAYQQLYNELAVFEGDVNGSPLAREIYNIYKLGDLKQDIASKMLSFQGKGGKKRMGPQLTKKLNSQLDARGGLTLEVVYNEVAGIMLKSIESGIKGGSIHSGQTGMKADYIVGLNIDMTPVEEAIDNWFNDGETVSREKNVREIQKLHEKIKDIDSGFIVYANAKNQKYTDNFKGFSSGKPITPQTFENIMSGVSWNSNFQGVMGAILQLADGAIGKNILNKFDFELLLAKNVAYLLFDDVDQIGVENQSGTNALHVLNLNGVYIPISLILFALADAIDAVNTEEARRLVNVTITSPPIVFNSPIVEANGEINWMKTYQHYGFSSPSEAWEYQRNAALTQTKIQMRFLKNFQEIIQTYITKFER